MFRSQQRTEFELNCSEKKKKSVLLSDSVAFVSSPETAKTESKTKSFVPPLATRRVGCPEVSVPNSAGARFLLGYSSARVYSF